MLRNAVWNGMACDMTILPARICSICLCNPRAELRRPNPGVAPASHTRTYTRRTPVSQWRLIAAATSWAVSWRHPPPLYLVYKGLVPTFPFSFLIITFCFLSFVQFCCLSRFQPFRTQYVLYTASFFFYLIALNFRYFRLKLSLLFFPWLYFLFSSQHLAACYQPSAHLVLRTTIFSIFRFFQSTSPLFFFLSFYICILFPLLFSHIFSG